MKNARLLGCLAWVLGGGAVGQQVVQRVEYKLLAEAGDAIPGGDGRTISRILADPVMSPDGRVAFIAQTSDDTEALLLHDGSLRVLLETSDTPPAVGPWMRNLTAGLTVFAADGSITQSARYSNGPLLAERLVRVRPDGSVENLLATGDPAPGRPAGEFIGSSIRIFAASASGIVVIAGTADASGEPVSAAVFVLRDGQWISPRARSDASPDGSADFDITGISAPRIAADGTARWVTSAKMPDQFVFREFLEVLRPGETEPAIEFASTEPIAGVNPGAQEVRFNGEPVTIADRAAFELRFYVPDVSPSVMYGAAATSPSGPGLLAAQGDPAPGIAGATLEPVGAISMSGLGRVTIAGSYENSGGSSRELLLSAAPDGELEVIAAGDLAAPTLEPGRSFASFISRSRYRAPAITNSAGQTLFYATITAPSARSHWLFDPGRIDRRLFMLVETGRSIDLDPDPLVADVREMGWVDPIGETWPGSSPSADDGRPTRIADDAAVVFNGYDSTNFRDVLFVARVVDVHCPADINADGVVSPSDFNAWILAFNASAQECDQNNDGRCSASDFNAWILNYNAGCN